MKQLGIIVVTAIISGIGGGVIGAAVAVEHYGAMPHEWASWRQVSYDSKPGQIGSFEPIVVEDTDAVTTLRGTITTDAIRFTNGWVFRPEGSSLQLVDPQGVVRQTFPRE